MFISVTENKGGGESRILCRQSPPLLSDMGYAIRRNGGGKALPNPIGFEPKGISLPA